jgi:hypothetical protein
MNDFLGEFFEESESPMDSYEAFLLTTETLYKRTAWDRVLLDQPSKYANLRIDISFIPQDEQIVLQALCSDMIFDQDYEALSAPLIMKLNRQQSYGHFVLNEAGHVVFKYAISLKGKEDEILVSEIEEFREKATTIYENRYAALSVMKNHLKRLSDAGFMLEMDDFLPAVNDNPDWSSQSSTLNLAMMDIKGEG